MYVVIETASLPLIRLQKPTIHAAVVVLCLGERKLTALADTLDYIVRGVSHAFQAPGTACEVQEGRTHLKAL